MAKAAFALGTSEELRRIEPTPPLVEADVYGGEPGASSPLSASDFVPFKPLVDVLVCGALVLPAEVEQADVTLEVGARIRKTVRVYGDRFFMPGIVGGLAVSRPRRFRYMPITWERAFGGTDPDDPRIFEPRNPVGRGVRRHARQLEGTLAPNFEDPQRPSRAVGFGPIAPHWHPRRKLAGTYDEAWQDTRFPLLPIDFDERFFNVAPEDQQLHGYLPGEEVRLTYMTEIGRERFRLPSFDVRVRFAEYPGLTTDARIVPDTIIIEPAERRVSLVGRVRYYPRKDLVALKQVIVGEPTPGFLKALEKDKSYVDFRKGIRG